jgi:hypothetical protein
MQERKSAIAESISLREGMKFVQWWRSSKAYVRLTEHDDCAHAIFVYQVYRSNSLIDLGGGAGAEMKLVLELAKTVAL